MELFCSRSCHHLFKADSLAIRRYKLKTFISLVQSSIRQFQSILRRFARAFHHRNQMFIVSKSPLLLIPAFLRSILIHSTNGTGQNLLGHRSRGTNFYSILHFGNRPDQSPGRRGRLGKPLLKCRFTIGHHIKNHG